MSTDPAVAFFFLKRLSQRIQNLVEKIDQNTVHTVQNRLADFIVQRSNAGRGSAFSLGMTQSALAEELGTVREVVVRSLRSLREIGAIESIGAGKYRVSNASLLRKLVESGP
jgi:CRP/FNR family cyclic AMP-dependent transcriptional regulator